MGYAKIQLSSGTILAIGPRPPEFRRWPDPVLAAPAAHLDPCPPDLADLAWWPVIDDPVPAHDDTVEHAVAAGLTPDRETQTVRRAWRVEPRPDADARLETLRAQALAEVDAEAGRQRGRFITVVPGQEQTYVEKEGEARDLAAGGAGPWPFLEAEAAAVGLAVAELAAEVVATAETWRALAARIEATRRGVKVRIAAAAASGEIRAILADPAWPAGGEQA